MSAKELRKQQQAAMEQEWNEFSELVREALDGPVPADGRHAFCIPDSMTKDNSVLKQVMDYARKLHWKTERVKMDSKFELVCDVPQKKSRKK